MSRKPQYGKKIIKILAEKKAISVPELADKVVDKNEAKNPLYAIRRSLKGLEEAGLVESIYSGQNDFARLTDEGRKKMNSLLLESDTALVKTSWDGFWRIIILDVPEERKSEREALRYLLKKANFICIKNTVWISPHPYEHLFMNIKKDLDFTTELMIIVTDKLDPETSRAFLAAIKN